MKIHHNTLKKAKKFGIEMRVVENVIEALHEGKVLASGMSGNVVLEQAIAKLPGATPKKTRKPAAPKKARKSRDEEGDEDEDEEAEEAEEAEEGDEEEAGKSVVKKRYKNRYRPFKMTCGDDISQQVSAHVKVKDAETGKMKIDEAKLIRFAKANGVWDPNYKDMNIGMKRMNIANRLRGKIRRDKHEVVWAS